MSSSTFEIADQLTREQALDMSASILVQAPAGSGKTELLSMRFLRLLAEVDEPEKVLAITFTKAATAEMRHRILTKLEEARQFTKAGTATVQEVAALAIARAALDNSDRRGWRLIEQPQRLNIQTIDSLCLRIARQMPLRARLGGTLQPTENAWPLYRRAARKSFDRLGGRDESLNEALRALLLLRDNNLGDCEKLLAQMLSTRDQWSTALPLEESIDWAIVRTRLEGPFEREIARVLSEAHGMLASRPDLAAELCELANYSRGNMDADSPHRLPEDLAELPPGTAECLEHWRALCELLLNQDNDFRKSCNVAQGFPRGKTTHKPRMMALMLALGELPRLANLLCAIRELPPLHYSEYEWQTLLSMCTVLRQAVQELEAVFAEHGAVDFIEIGKAALSVLGGDSEGTSGQSSQRIQHLLVDEFQDTSSRQNELIAALLRGWNAEDGRTFFLVGDPMQSIYMFRQADVEAFRGVRQRGLKIGDRLLPVQSLQLTTNFRSNAGVVNPLNAIFGVVFPHEAKPEAASVEFLPGTAYNREEPARAFVIHPSFAASRKKQPDDSIQDESSLSPAILARRQETVEVLQVVQRHLPKIERARANGTEFTIALLARVKDHLAPIAAALRDAKIPFRAVEMERLGERQEILDLQSLTRALLHPMDRVAWLSLLRAPWCGLELRDLHLLCGTDEGRGAVVQEQIANRLNLLAPEVRLRVDRVVSVLKFALRQRDGHISFSSLIERAWNSLGGPACVDATGYENALTYFRMLEQIAPDGIAANGEEMEGQLSRLFARPDPSVSERCGVQLMSMHKAKGLGFNVVVLPGLHRTTRHDSLSLIRFIERTGAAGTEALAAPIGVKGEESSRLDVWVRRQKRARDSEERKRLLYVACTRAKDELHLFATATVTNSGLSSGAGSLLSTAWPAVQGIFLEKQAEDDAARTAASAEALRFPSMDDPGQAIPGALDLIAASGHASIIRRLPANWTPRTGLANITAASSPDPTLSVEPFDKRHRPEASRAGRTLGTVVHALLEQASRVFVKSATEDELRGMLPAFRLHAATLAKNDGLSPAEAESCARTASATLESALADPYGRWILRSRAEAQSEASWSGIFDGTLKTLRVDRSFQAGPEPLSEGNDCQWIIDYKTAIHIGPGLAAFLEAERGSYSRQLEEYGELMRLAHGKELQLRLGLYYPRLKEFIWWQA